MHQSQHPNIELQEQGFRKIGQSEPFSADNDPISIRKVPENPGNMEQHNKEYIMKSSPLNAKVLDEISMFFGFLSLNLRGNGLGNKGLRLLIEDEKWFQIKSLDLSNNQITKEGAKYLGINPSWPELRRLNLSGNKLTSRGIQHLADCSNWSKIQILDLSRTAADAQAAKALASNESWKDLNELYLDQNNLHDAGAALLSLNSTWSNLKSLSVRDCGVRSKGISSLRRNKTWKSLEHLWLYKDQNAIAIDLRESSFQKYILNNSSLGYEPKTAESCSTTSKESLQLLQNRDHGTVIKVKMPRKFENQRVYEPTEEFKTVKNGNFLRGGDSDSSSELILSCQQKMKSYKTRVLNDPDLERDMLFYTRLSARATLNPTTKPEDLEYDLRSNFFNGNSTVKSIVLLGPQGFGKSLFCRYLQRIMFINQSWDYDNWFPVLIPLSTLKNPHTSAISEILSREMNLTQHEITCLQEMKNSRPRFVFICDGYDEIYSFANSTNPKMFYEENGFGSNWSEDKVVITCRQDIISTDRKRDCLFGPTDPKTGKPVRGAYMERIIAPFTEKEIRSFLDKFNEGYSAVFGEEMEKIETMKQYDRIISILKMQQALNTPLLVSIIAQVLPEISKQFFPEAKDEISKGVQVPKTDQIPAAGNKPTANLGTTKPQIQGQSGVQVQAGTTKNVPAAKKSPAINERFIIHNYINRVLKRTVKKCISAGKLNEIAESEEAAMSLLRHQMLHQALEMSGYKVIKDINDPRFVDKQKEESLKQYLPLRKIAISDSEYRYEFIYKILQYFLVAKKLEIEIIDSRTKDPTTDMLFNQQSIQEKPLVVDFLIQAMKEEKIKPADLIKLVRLSIPQQQSQAGGNSMTEETVENTTHKQQVPSFLIGAVNAMFVLKTSSFDFLALDLSGIQIPGANLKGGKLLSTNFTGTDLSRVNLEGAALAGTNFKGANLTDTFFGEWNSVTLNAPPQCLAYSPDSRYVLAAVDTAIVVLEQNSNTCELKICEAKEAKLARAHSRRILSCGFSSDGKLIVSSGEDRKVKVWDFETCECIREYNEKALKCAFVPDSSNIMLATKAESSRDYSIRVKDTEGKIRPRKLQGHTTNVNAVAFSHDCKHLVSISNDQSVRIWDIARCRTTRIFTHKVLSPQGCFFTPDSKMVVVFDQNDYPLKVYDLSSGRTNEIRVENKFGVVACTFSSDQKYLVNTDKKGVIRIFTGMKWSSVFRNTNIECAKGLSESDILLFQQKGDFKNWSRSQIGELILNQSLAEKVTSINFSKIDFTEEDASVFKRNTTWVNLENLNLSKNMIGYNHMCMIAGNTAWKNLKVLNVEDNNIGGDGAAAIAKNPIWANLEVLNMSRNKLSLPGTRELAGNTIWTKLKTLILAKCDLYDKSASELATNTSWISLTELDLRDNFITDVGSKQLVIARSYVWKNLQSLILKGNDFTPTAKVFYHLNIKYTEMLSKKLQSCTDPQNEGPKIVQELEESFNEECKTIVSECVDERKHEMEKIWEKRQSKEVDGNLLKREGFEGKNGGADHIINHYWMPSVKSLDLSKEKVYSDVYVEKLCKNILLKEIEELVLTNAIESTNKITDLSVTMLVNASWSKLRKLVLYHDQITDEGAAVIGRCTVWPNLEELTLAGRSSGRGNITDKGAIVIASNSSWSNLVLLDLQRNKIGDEGAAAIARNSTWSKLERLDLSHNQIGNKGASALASNKTWKNLRAFVMGGNKEMTADGKKALHANPLFGNKMKFY